MISTVWAPGHYKPDCECESCTQTRQYLSPSDLHFINHVANEVTQPPPDVDA